MNDRNSITRTSKLLSLILRHDPEHVGIELDAHGWVDVDELLTALRAHGENLTKAELIEVVRKNDKQRFAVSADGERVRANQGHSVEVDLGLDPRKPPPVLFHGTADRFVESIRQHGVQKGKRQHVHLHEDQNIAQTVGSRHGRATVLEISSRSMHTAGFEFWCSANSVWLTDHVPPEFVSVVKRNRQ